MYKQIHKWKKKKAIFCNYRLLYRQKYDTPKTANRNTKKIRKAPIWLQKTQNEHKRRRNANTTENAQNFCNSVSISCTESFCLFL